MLKSLHAITAVPTVPLGHSAAIFGKRVARHASVGASAISVFNESESDTWILDDTWM